MKKLTALIILLLLIGVVTWLGIKRFSPAQKNSPVTIEQSRSNDQQSPVVGNIWDNNPTEALTVLHPLPAQNSNTNASPVEIPTPPPTLGEIQAPWPTTNQTPKEDLPLPSETTVSVGNPVPHNPQAEVLVPMNLPSQSEVIDPRKAEEILGISKEDIELQKMTPEERLEIEHEPTNIFVQRTFIASLPNGKSKTIRVKVPVVYKTRTLRLNPEEAKKAKELLEQAKALENKLVEAKKESESILKEWNRIWRASIPTTALLPESPSLPENQSASELNRPNPNPDLVPGKAATFEIE